jgi:hypothetical protein
MVRLTTAPGWYWTSSASETTPSSSFVTFGSASMAPLLNDVLGGIAVMTALKATLVPETRFLMQKLK